jgi:hypothetical protein
MLLVLGKKKKFKNIVPHSIFCSQEPREGVDVGCWK